VINPVTGIPVLDANTGQEIYQLCAMPVFSGKSWGLFKPGVDSI
jgi:hypothetical protein